MPPHKPHHHFRHVPSSAVTGFIDPAAIDALLARWVDDPSDRRFIVRCLVDEGPAHHRGANYILLSLLGQLLERAEAAGLTPEPRGPEERSVPVAMRLPPHLAERIDQGEFALRLPTAPVERLAARGTPAFAAMLDCLTDGPPQHALANAVMVRILGRLLAAGDRPPPTPPPAPPAP